MFAHDLSLFHSNEETDDGINERDCCVAGPVVDDRCLSIAVPKNDPFYSSHDRDCINSQRSRVCKCNIGKRVHETSVSSFQDLSHIYGNSEEESKSLRSFIRGMLSVDYTPASGEIPQPISDGIECNSVEEDTCFYKTGDPRENQNPLIMTAHIFLLRYHNKICEELYKIHRDWSDVKLFQEVRRIFIAQAQYITYSSYLPLLLGKLMDVYGISVTPNDLNYTKYDQEINPRDDTRNYLYKRNDLNETTGRDLFSLSILRGRDHGVPGYTYYQKFLNGNTIKSFDDLTKFIPKKDVDNLKKVYELSEQLREIKKSSLARIICDTSSIDSIQRFPFQVVSRKNPTVPCKEIDKIDYSVF